MPHHSEWQPISWHISGAKSDWVVNSELRRSTKHCECLPSTPACNEPEAPCIDHRPLTRVSRKERTPEQSIITRGCISSGGAGPGETSAALASRG
jgi:hypothetical protein